MRLIFLAVVGFLLVSYLPRCAQQLPQLAGNAAGQAAHGIVGAAGNALGNLGRSLWDHLKRIFRNASDQWDYASPADKFDLVCEHTSVPGVDKLCPSLAADLRGASNAETARIACYWHAAATAQPNPAARLKSLETLCARQAGNASSLEDCLTAFIDSSDAAGDAANCKAGDPEQLWPELHTMIEPIACPLGSPKSWCTTASSSASSASATPSPPPRTDVNYLNCLQTYYLTPAVRATYQASCGTSVNAGNESCVIGQLQSFNYPGQVQLGQQYVTACGQTQVSQP